MKIATFVSSLRFPFLCVVVVLGLCAQLPADVPPRPNIVFILADDLGWSDTTLYGTTKFYETPNIQRLAKRGMTFRRAYTHQMQARSC